MDPRPKMDSNTQPTVHGARWAGGVVLKGVSLGEGVPVTLNNPRRGLPRRGLSGNNASSTVKVEGGKIFATPTVAEGESFSVVAEY